MKKGQKFAIVISIAVIVLVVVFLLLKNNGYSHSEALGLALIPTIIVLIPGIPYAMKNKKEGFTVGAGDTINIIQNCGGSPSPSPSPSPPTPTPLSKKDILNWIATIDPSLTSECAECVVNNALKMWNAETLAQLKAKSREQQDTILNAMIAFDCSKQCVIPPSNLNIAQVDQWLRELMPSLSASCHQCAMKNIIKLWSADTYKKLLTMSKAEQQTVVDGLLSFNCPKCDTPDNLLPQEVQQWMAGLITGATPDCYKCGLAIILRMWSTTEFAKVKAMSKASQLQVLKALLALNCDKQCVEVPSGLTPQEVMSWLSTVLINGELSNCASSCIVPVIVRTWTPAMLANVKIKPLLEQQKIVQGIIALNCKEQCFGGPLNAGQLAWYVKNVLPSASADCQSCIVEAAMKNWTPTSFQELLNKSVEDQVKAVRLLADFNCPHVCGNLPAPQVCDYLPY